MLSRSNRGLYQKFNDALKIIEYGIMMIEFFELKEFNNVIAVQLRIVLCDTQSNSDNSLLRKINFEPKLFPANDTFIELDSRDNAVIDPHNLFNYSKQTIELDPWLNQVIYKMKLGEQRQDLTIKDFIKLSANKGGGAHVDSTLNEKAFLVDVHSDRFLAPIAKGLFRSLGRDFEENTRKNFIHLLNKIEEKSK